MKPIVVAICAGIFMLVVLTLNFSAKQNEEEIETRLAILQELKTTKWTLSTWEYRIIYFQLTEADLNSLGNHGWELCAHTGKFCRNFWKKMMTTCT